MTDKEARVIGCYDECRVPPTKNDVAHTLYTDEDADAPSCIKDSNGQVVLGLCKVCNRAEAELVEPCDPTKPPHGS